MLFVDSFVTYLYKKYQINIKVQITFLFSGSPCSCASKTNTDLHINSSTMNTQFVRIIEQTNTHFFISATTKQGDARSSCNFEHVQNTGQTLHGESNRNNENKYLSKQIYKIKNMETRIG